MKVKIAQIQAHVYEEKEKNMEELERNLEQIGRASCRERV